MRASYAKIVRAIEPSSWVGIGDAPPHGSAFLKWLDQHMDVIRLAARDGDIVSMDELLEIVETPCVAPKKVVSAEVQGAVCELVASKVRAALPLALHDGIRDMMESFAQRMEEIAVAWRKEFVAGQTTAVWNPRNYTPADYPLDVINQLVSNGFTEGSDTIVGLQFIKRMPDKNVSVWIEHIRPEDREDAATPIYTISVDPLDNTGEAPNDVLATDDDGEMFAKVRELGAIPAWRQEHSRGNRGGQRRRSSWETEFIGPFPQSTIEYLLMQHFEDTSYGNDTMPSFETALLGGYKIRVWVNYLDPAQRESGPDAPLYALVKMDDNNQDIEEWTFDNEYDLYHNLNALREISPPTYATEPHHKEFPMWAIPGASLVFESSGFTDTSDRRDPMPSYSKVVENRAYKVFVNYAQIATPQRTSTGVIGEERDYYLHVDGISQGGYRTIEELLEFLVARGVMIRAQVLDLQSVAMEENLTTLRTFLTRHINTIDESEYFAAIDAAIIREKDENAKYMIENATEYLETGFTFPITEWVQNASRMWFGNARMIPYLLPFLETEVESYSDRRNAMVDILNVALRHANPDALNRIIRFITNEGYTADVYDGAIFELLMSDEDYDDYDVNTKRQCLDRLIRAGATLTLDECVKFLEFANGVGSMVRNSSRYSHFIPDIEGYRDGLIAAAEKARRAKSKRRKRK